MDPKRIVGEGYDTIAARYLEGVLASASPVRRWFLAEIVERLPGNGRVLELGCGAGVPVGRTLARRARYVGVDLSRAQLALARANLPDVPLVQADITSMGWRPGSFDAIVAFYVFNHVAPARFEPTLLRIAGWLRPGGFFAASLPAGDSSFEDVEPDWSGVPMYFSGITEDEQDRVFGRSGLTTDLAEIRDEDEGDEIVRFRWVIARKGLTMDVLE